MLKAREKEYVLRWDLKAVMDACLM